MRTSQHAHLLAVALLAIPACGGARYRVEGLVSLGEGEDPSRIAILDSTASYKIQTIHQLYASAVDSLVHTFADSLAAIDTTLAAQENLIAQAERIACPVIGFFGGKDPAIPLAHVDEIRDTLKAKGKEAEVHLYPDAGHGFFSEERDDYNKDAADYSWSRTLAFFGQHLKQAAAAAG